MIEIVFAVSRGNADVKVNLQVLLAPVGVRVKPDAAQPVFDTVMAFPLPPTDDADKLVTLWDVVLVTVRVP